MKTSLTHHKTGKIRQKPENNHNKNQANFSNMMQNFPNETLADYIYHKEEFKYTLENL